MAASNKKVPYSTHIDLSSEIRASVVGILNQHLADVSDLKSQVKQAHWNVKGHHFYPLHLLFDEIAAELSAFTDEIAERAVSLGGYAHGTARMAASNSRLPEYPTSAVDGLEHVTALVERMGAYAASLRVAIDETAKLGDASTSDLFTEVSRKVDLRLWFLEAHLQGRNS